MIEFKDKVLEERVVVHCDKKWKAINLLEWAHSKGFKWSGGSSVLVYSNYGGYKEHTCYNILEKERMYCSLSFYKDEDYKIISYEEALKGLDVERGELVYISNISVKSALKNKEKRIFLADVGGLSPYICVEGLDEYNYPDGLYDTTSWKYVVKVPEPKKEDVEVTLQDVADKFGIHVEQLRIKE